MLRWSLLVVALGCRSPEVLRPPGDDGSAAVRAPKVAWTADVGRTTYRARLVRDGDVLLVPSNGDSWDGTEDPDDALFVVDAASGDVQQKLVPPGDGERDVNGVTVAGGSWWVSTDQGAVHRYRPDGTVVWSADTGGDVEGPPGVADLNGDGELDVAVGVELGPVLLLNGVDGTELHRDATPRNPFPQPVPHDLDGDGAVDLLVASRNDNSLRAMRGSGELLWTLTGSLRYSSPPQLHDIDGDGTPEILAGAGLAVMVADLAGHVKLLYRLTGRDGNIFGFTWYPDGDCIVLVRTATDPNVTCLALDGTERWTVPLLARKATATPVVADVDGIDGAEVVIATEGGAVFALNPTGRQLWRLQLGGSIETPVLIDDLTGNGRNELVVASHDGVLTAFRTLGRADAP